jgi:hypothetical protein
MIINVQELTPTQRRKFCEALGAFQENNIFSDVVVAFGPPIQSNGASEIDNRIKFICNGRPKEKEIKNAADLAVLTACSLQVIQPKKPGSFNLNYADLLSHTVAKTMNVLLAPIYSTAVPA